MLAKVTTFYNQIDSRLLIVWILGAYCLSFHLYGGEEQYFGLAKQYYQPDWIPNSFTFTEWAGTRYIYQVVIGFLLSFLSFEQVAFFGRLANFILLSFPLAALFRLWKWQNTGLTAFLLLFFAFDQNFFAGEWIFGGLEPKTLAYIGVLWALFFILKEKIFFAIISVALATYLHVLVGAWFFILLLFYWIWERKTFRQLFKYTTLYGLLVLPLFIYLVAYLAQSEKVINGINLNWVYVYYRLPHHLAPFSSMTHFRKKYLDGLLICLFFFIVGWKYFRYQTYPYIQKITKLCLIAFSIFFFSVFVAYFDKIGNYLKYYPFRLDSIALFLTSAQVVIWFKNRYFSLEKNRITPTFFTRKIALIQAQKILLVVCLPVLLYQTTSTLYCLFSNECDFYFEEMTHFVGEATPENAVFMLLHTDELAFCRKTKRDRFAVFKFVPAGGNKLYDWYVKLQEKEKVKGNIGHIFEVEDKYKVDYLVSRKVYQNTALTEVFHNEQFWIYRLGPKP